MNTQGVLASTLPYGLNQLQLEADLPAFKASLKKSQDPVKSSAAVLRLFDDSRQDNRYTLQPMSQALKNLSK